MLLMRPISQQPPINTEKWPVFPQGFRDRPSHIGEENERGVCQWSSQREAFNVPLIFYPMVLVYFFFHFYYLEANYFTIL